MAHDSGAIPAPHHPVFAAVYDRLTRPLEAEVLAARRAALLGGLEGRVLDVGAGTGVNLAHFRSATEIVAVEPDRAMRRRLGEKAADVAVPVETVDALAESLPLHDGSFDAVVFTCTLCTVTDPARALAEARRVLRPSGRLVVLEHVRGSGRLARRQDRITPLWSRIAGGCHPNRDIHAAVQHAGFEFDAIDAFDPFPRWVPSRPMIQGVACMTGLAAR